MNLLRGLEMEDKKMGLDEIKKLLEEMYEMRLRWNELEPGENPYEVVEVIEEIYSNIFGSDEFDEFIKRKEDEEEQLKSEILEKFKVLGDSITPSDYENNDDYEREDSNSSGVCKEGLRWTSN